MPKTLREQLMEWNTLYVHGPSPVFDALEMVAIMVDEHPSPHQELAVLQTMERLRDRLGDVVGSGNLAEPLATEAPNA